MKKFKEKADQSVSLKYDKISRQLFAFRRSYW